MAKKRRDNGEGSLFWSEKEETWIAQVTLPNDHRKRKRSKDKAKVQKWLFEQRKAITENRLSTNENMTVNQFADQFLKDVANHTLKLKTYITYESYLRLHIRPALGRVKLVNLQSSQIQRLYSEKINSGLSKKTVHHIHSTLRRVLNEAVKWEIIHKNPCDAVTPPRVDKQIPTVWNIEESKKFLKAVEGHRWYGIYLIALTTGARRGEILGMEWQNIRWDAGTISIEKTVSEIKGKAVVTMPKTAKSLRTIVLPSVVVNLLKENMEKSGFIFTSLNGTPITPRNLLRHFYSVLEKINVPKIRFHDMRHTVATILLQKDTHPVKVQQLLGHASITTTLDVYSHILPPMKSEVAEKMDDVFKG